MVEVNNIVKKYKNILAVDRVSFNVNKGELFGLIGPDGSGKTSIFRILTTLVLPDEGYSIVNGRNTTNDFKYIRKDIGYMPGRFSLYQDLTVEENLNFFATLFNTSVKVNYNLIKDIYIQLEPFKDRRAGKLSGGMKQKLALCCALIHKPKVLFLDEPTTGVDTVSRKEFWEMLKKLIEQEITILVSTPYMDEASLCDRIALIQEGRILSIDTPQNISERYPYTLYSIKSNMMSQLLRDLRNINFVMNSYSFGDSHHFSFVDDKREQNLNQLELILREKNHTDIEIESKKASIEDCFIDFMTK